MSQTRDHAVSQMEKMLVALQSKLTPPELTAKGTGRVFRYRDKSAPQALVQKLARVVSGISAIDILLERGYLQEGATLIRVISEMIEDSMFLSKAILTNDDSEFLGKYLAVFYEETIPGEDDLVVELNRRRTRISRKEVRDATDRYNDELRVPQNELRTTQVVRAVTNLYSEFVHGSSSQIMDMCGGNPLHFHVKGLAGTPPQVSYQRSFDEVVVSAAHAFSFAAMAFSDEPTMQRAGELVALLQSGAPSG